jgi:hypothetical protein
VDVADSVARYVVRTPSPGPTSSTTSSGLARETADDPEDVLVDEEVLSSSFLAAGSFT